MPKPIERNFPPKSTVPKILFLDIETLPNVAYVWGKYEQNVLAYTQESCIATFAAKWLDHGEVFSRALPDYPGYKAGSYDDARIVRDLWELFNEADIIVTHNGIDFDNKVCAARFIYHSLNPPSPYKNVDTKRVAKRVARFNSNRLDDIGNYLSLGRKIKTDFTLWEGCITGKKQSWDQMVTYNKQDVLLLEKVYLILRPWVKDHPNFTIETRAACPKCNSNNIQYRGHVITSTRKYRKFQCNNCGGWGRVIKSEGSAETTSL